MTRFLKTTKYATHYHETRPGGMREAFKQSQIMVISAEAFRPYGAQIRFIHTTRVHNPPLIPPLELSARSLVGLLLGSLLASCCQL